MDKLRFVLYCTCLLISAGLFLSMAFVADSEGKDKQGDAGLLFAIIGIAGVIYDRD